MKSRLGVIAVSAILASMIGVSGCSTPGAVSRSNMNTTINVQHGVVTEVKQVDVESNAARNSMLGGLAGLALTSRRSRSSQIAGAAGGALLSGLLTKSAESSQLVNAKPVEPATSVGSPKYFVSPPAARIGRIRISEKKARKRRRSATTPNNNY